MLVILNLAQVQIRKIYTTIFYAATGTNNSVPAHDLSKLSLLEAYNAQHKFDMMFLLETLSRFFFDT